MIAISVDSPEKNVKFAEKLGLTFPLFHDANAEVIKKWGIYDSKNEIAIPSTFIVDGQGKIRWSYVGKAASDRPSPEQIDEGQQAAQ